MRILVRRQAVVAAALTVAAGLAAGALALKPAVASDGTIHIGPYVLVTCNHASPNPCQQYKNTGTGIGVEGDAAHGTGVKGTAIFNGAVGVEGFGGNSGIAVKGVSTNANAVEGDSSSGSGVYGNSTNGLGVYGLSSNSAGVLGDSSSTAGEGGFFDDFASGYGVQVLGGASGSSSLFAQSRGGTAGYFDAATNGTGYGIISYSFGSVPVWTHNGNGNGAEFNGTYVGVVSRAPAGGSTYPLVLTDPSANNLFFVDGNGNVFYHGTLNPFLRTHSGGTANGYGAVSTSPTVEDDGTAQLKGGVAFVPLDRAFAQTIDTSKAYHVMLTPDGDTRGLFVASKTPTGFVVRELQGGRSSISFDYHIYAPALGRSNDRMAVINGAIPGPRATLTRPPVLRAHKMPVPGK